MKVREDNAGEAVVPPQRRLKLRVRNNLSRSMFNAERRIIIWKKIVGDFEPSLSYPMVSSQINFVCMLVPAAQPNLKQYCSIKVLEYNVHMADPVNHPDKGILQVLRLEVVKTAEVRDLIYSTKIDSCFNQENRRIGNPEPWKNDGKSAAMQDENDNQNSGNPNQSFLSRFCSIN